MRTEYCGLTDTRFLGQRITLFGGAHRRRDHGGVIFVDLRDREGLVQVVCDPDRAETFATADQPPSGEAMPVPSMLRPGENEVDLYAVSGDEGARVLHAVHQNVAS